MQAVPVGKTTVFGGSVTLVAFALAIVAYLQGARDEATLGTLAVGLVGLVGTLGGRYGQAIAALFADRSSWGARRSQHVPTESQIGAWPTTAIASSGNVTWTSPRAGVAMNNPIPQPSRSKAGEFDREPTAPHPDEIRDLHDGETT